jgi:hypothetical protein
MKVRMHDKPSRGSYPRHIPQYLPPPDRTPLLWWLSLHISLGVETHSSTNCRFPHFLYQAASYMLQMLPLSKYVYSMSARLDVLTLLRRRLQRIVPGFPSPYFDTKGCLSLEQTLWLRKERSGRSTERLPLRHSQRYCPGLCSSPDAEYYYQKNNKLVWDEAIRIMMDLFDNVWGDKSEVVVDHCADLTLPVRSLWFRSQTLPMSQRLHQISLFVISVAGTFIPDFGCDSLMAANTRVRPSGDMDN